jgi:hypothetical protein
MAKNSHEKAAMPFQIANKHPIAITSHIAAGKQEKKAKMIW